ncbi:MAG: DUF4416 family protein [bacterium]
MIAGILYSDDKFLSKSLELLESEFGEIDYKSICFKFDITDYYNSEMGNDIYRIFISFKNLISPDLLAAIKIQTNNIESKLSISRKRTVNIDSGYLDYDKIVLASGKYNGNKIYLNNGIWADLTLHYQKGVYHPYPWSFPDFKKGAYDNIFLKIREIYKKQMKDTSQ